MTAPEIITFGCRLNTFESEVMRRHAQDAGLGDVVVVHTCAVTEEAERQARQAIRRAKRVRPEARIVVTGCSAQLHPERYAQMAEVDRVVGNDAKLAAGTWQGLFDAATPVVQVADIMAVKETSPHLVDGFDGRSRAFVQVQQGCDHRCTFCIIPYGRGNSRSVGLGAIRAQVERLLESGYREIVLTGVDLTSYGRDLPGQPTLGSMLKRLLRLVPELARVRVSSIDPAEVDPDLADLLTGEARVMPHVHLSVQAGSDLILKRMKRRHLRHHVIELTERLRRQRPELAFGADLIAGFPTETEANFQDTLDLVEEAGLSFLHVFPYSPRPGTPAAKMPQVAKAVRKARAARLRAAGDEALDRLLTRLVGREHEVLVERGGRGHTPHFAPIVLDGGGPDGQIVKARAEHRQDGLLYGKVAA
ncbi:MAG: tRNA (N(6)-L-threonylcarbamoyladenosine(37)-C(2))-methylthiotransferase MtaB [Geminicoccaceae bacterium]|nr:MAG: tRNA (N(6)-L-threonylcarbamoyladenosine(37)-C(2))-methylthiotransferase MtaB [Geminicoccaceae bacterium]